MKTIYNLPFAALLFGCLAIGCKKNSKDATYKDVNRLILSADSKEGAVRDSILFSFAAYPSTLVEQTISVLAYTMGAVSDKSREFRVSVDPSSTALATEYVLPTTFTMPAGAVIARIPIKVKRTSRLANDKAKLVLRIEPNENFQPGSKVSYYITQSSSGNQEYPSRGPSFIYVWTDQLVKPLKNWPSVGPSFQSTAGIYSVNKHRFLLNAQDLFKDLDSPEALANRYVIAAFGAKALLQYNLANPNNPILNDSGVPIRICSGCP